MISISSHLAKKRKKMTTFIYHNDFPNKYRLFSIEDSNKDKLRSIYIANKDINKREYEKCDKLEN